MQWLEDLLAWFRGLFGLNNEEGEQNNLLMPGKTVEYLINDPTTPDLKMNVIPPDIPKVMPILVRGYKGPGFKLGTVEGQAAQALVTVGNSLKQLSVYSEGALKKWSRTRQLTIWPRAGKDFNAYFDGRNLKFFYEHDVKTRKMIFTVDSNDVVAHEFGHCSLDCLRPQLWSAQSLEVWGFHEAFADITAILSILLYDKTIKAVLKETNGNLRQHNLVSKLAEEMGTAIYNITKGRDGRKPGALRNAINSFKYSPPESLPQDAPDNQLAGECHSFGRVFLGAWYDAFVGVYEHECIIHKPSVALERARDAMGTYFVQGAMMAPINNRFYNGVARAMLTYMKAHDKTEHMAIVKDVFTQRRILAPRKVSMLSDDKINSILKNPENKVEEVGNLRIVRAQNIEKVTLANEMKLTAMASNPLFNLEVEVPQDMYFEFDKDGNMLDHVMESRDDALNSARVCLIQLHNSDGVGENEKEKKPFVVENGALVRSKFID